MGKRMIGKTIKKASQNKINKIEKSTLCIDLWSSYHHPPNLKMCNKITSDDSQKNTRKNSVSSEVTGGHPGEVNQRFTKTMK